MNRTTEHRLPWVALLGLLACVPLVELGDGPCPCAEEFFCCEATQVCAPLGDVCPGEPLVLDALSPGALIVDSRYIHWISEADGAIVQLRLDGTERRILADDQIGARALSQKDSALFWLSRGRLMRTSIDASEEVQTLSDATALGTGKTQDLYWALENQIYSQSCEPQGAPKLTHSLDENVDAMLATDEGLFVFSEGTLSFGRTVLAKELRTPNQIALHEGWLYFDQGDALVRLDLLNASHTLEVVEQKVERFALDSLGAGRIYWMGQTKNDLFITELSTMKTTRYARNRGGVPRSLVIGRAYIYWSEETGIMRVPKIQAERTK